MRHKLRVSRYGGGRALVCGILGGGHPPWALSLLEPPRNNHTTEASLHTQNLTRPCTKITVQ